MIGWTSADPAPPPVWHSASASLSAILLVLFLVMIAVLYDPDLLLLPRKISSFSS